MSAASVLRAGNCTQLEALDLAGRGFRQLRYEFDPARVFVRRQPVFDVLLQGGGELGRLLNVWPQHDKSLGFDQAVFIGVTDDRGFEHRLV